MSEKRPMTMTIDGLNYELSVHQSVRQPPAAPRLLIVSYLPNPLAGEILRTCLRSLETFTSQPHEVWVIDNASPPKHSGWLRDWSGINLIINHTPPIPLAGRGVWARFRKKKWRWLVASYQNALALEIATRVIDPQTHFIMPLHMDVMMTHESWLPFLLSRLTDKVRAAGMLMERTRFSEGVLHVHSLLVDFQLYRQLGLDFLPDLPTLDVGDKITLRLREAGYEVYACRNSQEDSSALELLSEKSLCYEFNKYTSLDRAFDAEGELIQLHFGRGVIKSKGEYHKEEYLLPEEWNALGARLVAAR